MALLDLNFIGTLVEDHVVINYTLNPVIFLVLLYVCFIFLTMCSVLQSVKLAGIFRQVQVPTTTLCCGSLNSGSMFMQ